MVETLPKVLRGEIAPVEQDHARATLSPKIEKEDGRIDWRKSAIDIERMIRAYTPWPGTITRWDGFDLKIVRAATSGQTTALQLHEMGQVIRLDGDRVGVVTGDGVLELREVQLAGKRVVPIEDFVRGQPRFVGSILRTRDE